MDYWEPITQEEYLAKIQAILKSKSERWKRAIAETHTNLANRHEWAERKSSIKDLKIQRAVTVLSDYEADPEERIDEVLEILTHATGKKNDGLERYRANVSARDTQGRVGRPRTDKPTLNAIYFRIRRNQNQSGEELGIQYRVGSDGFYEVWDGEKWQGGYKARGVAVYIVGMQDE